MSVVTIYENELLENQDINVDTISRVIKEQNSIKHNDLVIHIDYGLGKFVGIENILINNINRDFLKIEYGDSSNLLIPVENIDLITRYGEYSDNIILDKLGRKDSKSWSERKKKVGEKIKIFAKKLVEIAVKRQQQEAQIFIKNKNEFDNFCNSFIFKATNDQKKATDEILSDLASGKVMDRLLCGDVGFGKTEVAIRSSFVVVKNEKKAQVAIIVPTTLLCRQHYKKFIDRFKNFDVNIASLSRFNNLKEKKEIKSNLENGNIDIIIGTHSLLNDKIKFKNLGLVIIDEEQSFGVKQKEKLKELSFNFHILSMSATPIPRTLQMSMSGIRDLSLITTPPLNRINIETKIIEYNDVEIKDIIEFEINRGGRVFIVVPRITDIVEVENRLKNSIANIPYCSLHGKIDNSYIDVNMNKFYDGVYKVLICTTIIESGLDIPFANTIIIYRANNFGLAQLYQLRGRVGRSDVQAFAYLTTKKNETITELARKRLDIIGNIKELNSGFIISSEDMDLRGAGNLLGEEQTGHIKEVGIELYNQMFREAVKNVKLNLESRQNEFNDFNPEIKLEVSTAIPDEYVDSNIDIKMKIYKQTTNIKTLKDKIEIEHKLINEYGYLHENINNLLKISEIKIICKKLNIQKIEQKNNIVNIYFFENNFKNSEKLLKFIFDNKDKISIKQDRVVLKIINNTDYNIFTDIMEFLHKLLIL